MTRTADFLEESLISGTDLPLIVQSRAHGLDLADWVFEHRAQIEKRIAKYGAILFRGFGIDSVTKFDRLIRAASDRLMNYQERSSPRSQLGERIYTSTNYPENQHIFPHNEHSYSMNFPLRLFFCCETPARTGGQTPLADCRRVLHRIPIEIQNEFRTKRWMYVRNFGSGVGLPWSTVFQTKNKAEVEKYCKDWQIRCEWRGENGLRTIQVRDAIAKHPRTGELVWFNHVAFFHISTLGESIQTALSKDFSLEDLPNQTYYGDGSNIELSTLDILRDAYRQELISFDWAKGDAIIVDNMLVAHSRMPFAGTRRILFAMAEPTRRDLLA